MDSFGIEISPRNGRGTSNLLDVDVLDLLDLLEPFAAARTSMVSDTSRIFASLLKPSAEIVAQLRTPSNRFLSHMKGGYVVLAVIQGRLGNLRTISETHDVFTAHYGGMNSLCYYAVWFGQVCI